MYSDSRTYNKYKETFSVPPGIFEVVSDNKEKGAVKSVDAEGNSHAGYYVDVYMADEIAREYNSDKPQTSIRRDALRSG